MASRFGSTLDIPEIAGGPISLTKPPLFRVSQPKECKMISQQKPRDVEQKITPPKNTNTTSRLSEGHAIQHPRGVPTWNSNLCWTRNLLTSTCSFAKFSRLQKYHGFHCGEKSNGVFWRINANPDLRTWSSFSGTGHFGGACVSCHTV